MKKLLLILIVVFYSGIIFAREPTAKEIVTMTQTTVKTKNVRSVVIVPKVWYSNATCNLSVKFYSVENCTLLIYDADGSVVEQFSVISDGSEHSYPLPDLQGGDYIIEISTPQRTFEGELSI